MTEWMGLAWAAVLLVAVCACWLLWIWLGRALGATSTLTKRAPDQPGALAACANFDGELAAHKRTPKVWVWLSPCRNT